MDAVGFFLLALPVATAVVLAASARLPSLVSTLLAAYVALVAEVAVVTWALSPFEAVTRRGLALACTALLAGALALWWRRGRPGLPLAAARRAAGEVGREPVTLAFGVAVALLLGYELLLVLTAPPNNWDSLTYHLARAAAWAQEGGIHWIPNAPTDRMNEFQPLAEQQLLFLFVATGEGALFALPQYLAQLAILVAVYGASRRLGFAVRQAACAAFGLATFGLVALESTTAQNDLVAASFPVVAVCLVLGGRPLELALAGAALGLGVGAKLTTLLVWPVLAVLVWRRGRRAVALAGAGAVAGFAAASVWGFALNLAETGHVLGRGGGRVEVSASPSFPDSLETGLRLVFRALDLSTLSNGAIAGLAAAGVALATGLAWARRRAGARRALVDGAAAGIPLLVPALMAGAAVALAFVTREAGIPVETASSTGGINRASNEDYSAFGPLGAAALLGASVATAVAYRARRANADQLALALALPVFLVLLSLTSASNPFLTRFLLVPAALTAPLFARFFVGRAVTAAILVVALLTVTPTLRDSRTKPLDGPQGRPWTLTRAGAVMQTWQPGAGAALEELDRLVPPDACLGAVLGRDEPSYLLWGPRLERRVLFLPSTAAVTEALRLGLFRVVVSTGDNAPVAGDFEAEGWTVRPLADYWLLAEAPGAAAADACRGRG